MATSGAVAGTGTVGPVSRNELTDTDRAILTIERGFYRVPGSKVQRIRVELVLSETRCYQLLNALLDNPAALTADPVLVGRLRRIRDARRPPTTDE
jgi:hypothetical protein